MTPRKTKVDPVALVHGLADGKSHRELATQLHASRRTISSLAASNEIQTALKIEREKRAGLSRETADEHVAHITGRMVAAASGEWTPDATQLKLAGIFLGWWPPTGPAVAPDGGTTEPGGATIAPGTPLHFQIIQATRVETAKPDEGA